MTENKLVDDAPEACPSLADTAAAVAEGQIAQALCGETLCPLPAEESYRCKALAGVKRIDNFDTLRDSVAEYMTADDVAKLERAYLFARRAHDGQYRKSGEPYIVHPVEVAIILSQLNMDMQTVTAALLHDVVEDCDVSKEEVARLFSPTVAELVDGVTKITRIEVETLTDTQVATIRKMLVAMSHDIRVIVIKLADRLHNMRTLMGLKEDRRIFKSKETMEIYAPLANRLGMNSLKWELEDLAFSYLEPSKYNQVKKMVNETREARESYIDNAVQLLEHELAAVGVSAKIYGRPKHLYSIYQKMTSQGKGFSEIYDLSAVRVIVNDIPGCYAALGAVHNMWKPLPGRFKDYIAMPKNNMYQSLHTTVIGPAGRPLEVQIRTEEMHRQSEYGVAAHWRYKEKGETADAALDQQLAWLRQMVDWQDETQDSREFLKDLKVDLAPTEVFVFTPKGEVMSLRAGSTPVDFAYAIHTEVGNHCVGAKVNGAIVPLTYELQLGDRVEILTQKSATPSRDWLNIVKTSSARNKIRGFFSKASRSDDLQIGRDRLTREMKKHGVGISSANSMRAIKTISEHMGYKSPDDMLVNIGTGKESPQHVGNRLLKLLVDDVYGVDVDSLEQVVGNGLRERKLTLAVAESCTGGLLSKRLTDIPGASDYYLGGVCSYSNSVKEKVLGVKKETLDTVGAVSPETAEQMAVGVANALGSDIGVGITGIAGPGGGTEDKPTGLVYISVWYDGKFFTRKMQSSLGRDRVRMQAASTALDLIRRHIF